MHVPSIMKIFVKNKIQTSWQSTYLYTLIKQNKTNPSRKYFKNTSFPFFCILIDWIGFYTVSAIFQPYNVSFRHIKQIIDVWKKKKSVLCLTRVLTGAATSIGAAFQVPCTYTVIRAFLHTYTHRVVRNHWTYSWNKLYICIYMYYYMSVSL